MYRIAVAGNGNVGRAVASMCPFFDDTELKYIFTRREDMKRSSGDVKLLPFSEIKKFKNDIDCVIIAFGSAELPKYSFEIASDFNTVDSFDIHENIREYQKRVNGVAEAAGTLSLVSSGWDPGLLSIFRTYISAFMPYAKMATVWGQGISQGHSFALRMIPKVKYAAAYTVPVPNAKLMASAGIPLSDTEAHVRRCYIVADRKDEEGIESQIRANQAYFGRYKTEIYFISEEEFKAEHSEMPHRGEVIASGRAGKYRENRAMANISLEMDSNPEFTAGILIASAIAVIKLAKEGKRGAITLLDIPPKYFSDNPYKFL